ncbi:hypothetical protein, partial [Candidatus Erwinia dacicola]|uniref:hypothetical protein n=1 Tax=Candidatus Erwinia dacicola TaxID=252393 RepID=UPI001C9D0C00
DHGKLKRIINATLGFKTENQPAADSGNRGGTGGDGDPAGHGDAGGAATLLAPAASQQLLAGEGQ